MKFVPKTQAQLDEENLLPIGKYPFTVKESVEKTDKNSNAFFSLKVLIHAPNGTNWFVFDNVSMAWFAHKFLHLCEATGLSVKYESGNIEAADLLDREGFCEVAIAPAKGGYPAKNVIDDYYTGQELRRDAKVAKPAAPSVACDSTGKPVDDSDIPF